MNGISALFIDADNTSASLSEKIFDELSIYESMNIRRAFGNWKSHLLNGWEAVLYKHAITPVQQFALTQGKNASDIALVIDAMDVLYREAVDTFCIVSSDCDFTPLAVRLRSAGKSVIGLGSSTTCQSFIDSCTSFILLETNIEKSAAIVDKDGVNPTLISVILRAIDEIKNKAGWASLSKVGTITHKELSFDIKNEGFTKFSLLVENIPELELGYTGTTTWVRRVE
jgi:uncharacterized LabA/DUF88 family protein